MMNLKAKLAKGFTVTVVGANGNSEPFQTTYHNVNCIEGIEKAQLFKEGDWDEELGDGVRIYFNDDDQATWSEHHDFFIS